MPHTLNGPPFARRLVAGLLSLMLWPAPPALAGQARQPAEPPATLPDRPFEGELAGAGRHLFRVNLQAGEFLQVRVEQKGVDVLLRLLDSGGAELARMDSPNGAEGFETLSFIAAGPGVYGLEVSAFDAKAGKGLYRVWRESLREATAQGWRRVEVERLFVGAMGHAAGGRAEEAVSKLEEALGGWQGLGDGYMAEMTARQVNVIKANAAFSQGERAAAARTPAALRESLPHFEKARELYRRADFAEGEARCLAWLGSAHNALGDRAKALEYAQLSLPPLRAAGDKQGEAAALKFMGEVYTALGEGPKAADAFRQALPLVRSISETYAALGDDEKTLEYVEQMLQLLRALGDKGGEGVLLNNLGLAVAAAGEKQKALELYQQALPLLRAAGDKQGEAAALSNVSEAYAALGEQQKSADAFAEATAALRAAGDKRGEAGALAALGAGHVFKGEYPKALEALNQSLALARASGDKGGEATALALLGFAHIVVGETGKSAEPLDQAMSIFKAAKDTVGEATVLLMTGAAHNNLGDKQEAARYMERALPLFRAAGAKADEAATLMQLGAVYTDLGEVKKSSDYTRQSLQLQQQAGEAGGAVQLSNVATAQMLAGDMRKARHTFNQALPSVRTFGVKGMEAQMLMNVGLTYIGTREFAKGVEYLNQALASARATGNKRVEANALTYGGLFYLAAAGEGAGNSATKPNARQALNYLGQAVPLAQAIGDRQLEARALTFAGIAILLTTLDDEDERVIRAGLDSLRRALPLAKATGDKVNEALALLGVAAGWYGLEEREDGSIFLAKLSVNKIQRLRHTGQGLDVVTQKDLLNDIIDPYRLLATLLFDEERPEEAIQVLSLYQDEQFFDPDQPPQPARQVIQSPREAAFAALYERTSERVAQAGARITELKRRLGGRQPGPAEGAQLAGLEAELDAASKAFVAALDEAEAAFSAADAEDKVGTVPEVAEMQATLRGQVAATGQRTVALYTLISDEDFYVALVTPDRVSASSSSVEAAGFKQKVLNFHAVLQAPRSDPRPLGKELYDLILKPVEAELKGAGAQTLLWSLDGHLRYVPVAALSPDGRGYLVEQYQSVVFTRADRVRMAGAPSPSWTGTGFGSSRAHRVRLLGEEISARALPGVADELRAIFGSPPGAGGVLQGAVFADAAFTRSAFYQALRARRPLVHIASHFKFLPGDDARSFLLLGDGTALPLGEMKGQARLFDGVELLTLSACNTAAQQQDDAEGKEIDGFAELAQRLGAGAVLATLWPVVDETTAQLMSDFYSLRQQRAAGVTKAEALRRAQLALLNGPAKAGRATASGPAAGAGRDTGEVVITTAANAPPYPFNPDKPYAHPYYWSPFVLYGNWR